MPVGVVHEHPGEQAGLKNDRKRRGTRRPRQGARREGRKPVAQPFAEIEARLRATRRRGIGLDIGHQLLHRAGRGGAEGFVEADRLDQVLTDRLKLDGQFRVAGERLLDLLRVTAA